MSLLRGLAWTAGALAAAALSLTVPIADDARLVLAILAFTMVLWISEQLPLAVTGLGASVLLILVVGRGPNEVFAAYFDPVIVLLLGGFSLGVALSKHGLDAAVASALMRRAGGRPATVLLIVMATTAVFSMWISNTASTAIMLPIALGVVVANPLPQKHLARNLVLGVAFSANVGGIATPIGTTANAIALRFLAQTDTHITFLGWMARAVPLVIIMVVALWAILVRIYPMGSEPLQPPESLGPIGGKQWGVLAVFGLTVVLWLTTDVHGVPAAVVAVVPVVLFAASRLLAEEDLSKLGWPTLLLIGSGLALGDAVAANGLDLVFRDVVAGAVGERGGIVAFAAIGMAGLVLTLVASNTAAAVIMVPLAISLAGLWDIPLTSITMLAAAALSLDFLVPVGTPPNAMAYGTGHVNVAQMAKAGALASIVGLVVAVTLAWAFW